MVELYAKQVLSPIYDMDGGEKEIEESKRFLKKGAVLTSTRRDGSRDLPRRLLAVQI